MEHPSNSRMVGHTSTTFLAEAQLYAKLRISKNSISRALCVFTKSGHNEIESKTVPKQQQVHSLPGAQGPCVGAT